MGYVYFFKDHEGKVIYVGKTKEINSRMSSHFGASGHLPPRCYEETEDVFYAKCKSINEARIYEIFYISRLKPRYNTIFNRCESISVELPTLNFSKYIPRDVIAKKEKEEGLKRELIESISLGFSRLRGTIETLKVVGPIELSEYTRRVAKTDRDSIKKQKKYIEKVCNMAIAQLDSLEEKITPE